MGEALRAVPANKFIRVKTVRKIQHPRRNALLLQYVQSAQDCVLARAVAVVAQVDPRGKALEQLGLFIGQGST